MNRRPLLRSLAQGLALALLYYGAARLGLLLAFKHTNASPVWIASGLAVVAMLWRGYRVAPFIALGAFAANALTFSSYGLAPLQVGALSASIALGNVLEAALCAFWLGRASRAEQLLTHPRGVLRLVAVAALGSLLASTIATLSLHWGAGVSGPDVAATWVTWWMGDSAGILLIAPLLLTWRAPLRLSRDRYFEAIVLLFALPVASLLVFGVWPLLATLYPLSYLVMPFLLWAVFRFGWHGATLALLLTSVVAIWGTIHGTGPLWVANDVHQSLLLLQTFMGVVTMTVLLTSAAIVERAQVRAALELRVRERTADLSNANRHLALTNDQLQATNQELHELQELRDNLTHMIMHDLRMPLHALDYALQLLAAQTQLGSGPQKAVQISLQSSRSLSSLTNNLLDLHMQEAGALQLHWQALEPRKLVEASLAQIEWLASYKKVVLSASVAPDLPLLRGDANKLTRVLVNLLDNALNATPAGGSVRLSAQPGENGAAILFSVADTGQGIAPADQTRIFEKFGQVTSSDSSQRNSSGLGLAFCRMIIEAHGARISVQSALGEGSVFWFTVPLAASPDATQRDDLSSSFARLASEPPLF